MSKEILDKLVEDSFRFRRVLQLLKQASSCEAGSIAKPIIDSNPLKNPTDVRFF